MQGKEKIAFVVRKSLDSWEGLRSTLGVLVENLYGRVFFIDCPIELPESKSEEEFAENLEMLEDLEGEAYTNHQADAERFEFLKFATLEEMLPLIKEYDLVVPFGDAK